MDNLSFYYFFKFIQQINDFDAKSHHDMLLHKQLPVAMPENIDDLKLQNEAFLQELQNQLKAGKSVTPAGLLGSPSPLLPFLPYLQHPYAPLPSDAPTPWNVPQPFAEDGETSMKKSAIGGFVDTPLNLSKPKSAEEAHKAMKMASNDGNNNSNGKNHIASGSKLLPGTASRLPRHPYSIPFNGEESDLFAACQLWPVMAAAAQHHHHNNSSSQANLMATNPRDMMGENGFANFSQAMAEASGKNKRSSGSGDQIGMSPNANEDKVRMVRQQGRGRNSADMIGKQ